MVVFTVHWHESGSDVHVSPSWTSLPTPSLWVVPVHQLWVPCLIHGTWTSHLFTFGNIHVSVLFSQIHPLSPPTESKSVLSICFSCRLLYRVVVQFSSVQLLSRVWHFATPWTAAHQASLPITNSQCLPKLMSIKSVMPCNHLILCRPLLLLLSIFPSIRVFSDESVLRIRWPKYWSFSFSISSSNEHSGLISFRMDWEGHHHHLSTFPIYALIYCIGVFFLTYFTLYGRLQFHPPH